MSESYFKDKVAVETARQCIAQELRLCALRVNSADGNRNDAVTTTTWRGRGSARS